MALTFRDVAKSSVTWGIPMKIEIRQQGTGSFVAVGYFDGFQFGMNPLTMPGDPANTDYVYAVQYSGAFTILQTGKTQEVAMLTKTSGTGLFDTDVEIKLTWKDGRIITLGTVSGYPLRLVPGFSSGSSEESHKIPCRYTNTEPVDSFVSKVSV